MEFLERREKKDFVDCLGCLEIHRRGYRALQVHKVQRVTKDLELLKVETGCLAYKDRKVSPVEPVQPVCLE